MVSRVGLPALILQQSTERLLVNGRKYLLIFYPRIIMLEFLLVFYMNHQKLDIGNLTELRQTSIGVTDYVWSTSGDERVRPEHAARNGKVYKWSEPPAGGHPGEDIQCRCRAIPVLDDLK